MYERGCAMCESCEQQCKVNTHLSCRLCLHPRSQPARLPGSQAPLRRFVNRVAMWRCLTTHSAIPSRNEQGHKIGLVGYEYQRVQLRNESELSTTSADHETTRKPSVRCIVHMMSENLAHHCTHRFEAAQCLVLIMQFCARGACPLE